MRQNQEKKVKRRIRVSIAAAAMLAFLLAGACAFAGSSSESDWTCFQNSENNNGVTARAAAPDAAHAVSLWGDVKMGTRSVTPPLIVGEDLFVASEKTVYRIDRRTGNVRKKAEALHGDVGFAMHPMVYADGTLYAVTDAGSEGTMIEAVDGKTLQPRWHSRGYTGLGLTQLTYRKINGKGYLYTGTGVYDGKNRQHYDEAKAGSADNGILRWFFCVSAEDGKTVWSIKDAERGFYWAGACVTDRYIVFGSDNGDPGGLDTDGSVIRSLDPLTGKEISRVEGLKGDFRSAIVRDGDFLYAGTMGGRFYRIHIGEDGTLAQPSASGDENGDFSCVDLGESIRGAAVVYKGRAYVGVSNKNTGNNRYVVLDSSRALNEKSEIYSVPVAGTPTGAPLLSVPEGDPSGARYLYFTCNVEPGGIWCIRDVPGQTEAGAAEQVFVPEGAQAQFCISPLAVSRDGILYYKNDSGYIMAIAPRLLSGVKLTTDKGKPLSVPFQPGMRDYQVVADDTAASVKLAVSGRDGETSCSLSVNGEEQGETMTAKLGDAAETKIRLRVKRGAVCVDYHFTVVRVTEKDAELSVLSLTEDGRYDDNLLGELIRGQDRYQTKQLENGKDTYSLWVLPLHSEAEVRVYARENVRDPEKGGLLKAGSELDYSWRDEMDDSQKYVIGSADLNKNTVVNVRVTSKDKSTTRDYLVTLNRGKSGTDEPKPRPEVKKPAPPAKVKSVSCKAGRKKLTLKWKKASRATGYEITVAKDRKFRKGKKKLRVDRPKKLSKTIRQKKGTVYVRMRAYARSGGKTAYGPYSKTVRVKVR
ncbi:hypothetical protein BHK98_08860 [Hornefia porci]|uniref:Fibronectin type-III domain-containing protein n=1 Tax=Hornefia porci TaxID=2652292 RepID=A0A1Q9JIY7_9FIRM|nr:hypothetical protein BHK98_08860 [Hornefia porci]